MAKKRDTSFSTRLHELRTAAGITQAQLAERANLHLGGLTKLEQGDREPGWGTVIELARALGVEVTAFLADAGEESVPRPRGRPTTAVVVVSDDKKDEVKKGSKPDAAKPADKKTRAGRTKAKKRASNLPTDSSQN